MEKLDRLGWAEGICFECHGVRLGIRANVPGTLEGLLGLLPPGWKPVAEPVVDVLYSVYLGEQTRARWIKRYHYLFCGALRLARTVDLRELYEALEFDLMLCVVGEARQGVFVHAGVVEWQGRAIVIPGWVGAGKTTLVTALVAAGASYYSDEFAVLDPQGRVHPFPVRPRIRPVEGQGTLPARRSLDDLGASVGTQAIETGLVVLAEYRPGAHWRPRAVSSGQAALSLLQNAPGARRSPGKVLAAIQQAVGGAQALRGTRGEASDTASLLLQGLGAGESG